MTKPRMRSELAIRNVYFPQRRICLDSTADAVMEYAEFGRLYRHPTPSSGGGERTSESYDLYVDPRFSFDEVLSWIQSHDERAQGKPAKDWRMN